MVRPAQCFSAMVLIAAAAAVAAPAAVVHFPARPGQADFISDNAALISPPDAEKIRTTCLALLKARHVPLIVVTIPSLAEQGAGGWTIERYATSLFDAWGIGTPEANYGILLLVSQGDRKARIELGAEWSRTKDRV